MPHATLKFNPGVNSTRTPALNETQLSDTQMVRFMPDRQGMGLVQKLGGWKKYYTSQLGTIIRSLWAWQDTNGDQFLGVGGQTESIAMTGGQGNGAQAIFTYSGDRIFTTGSPIIVEGFEPDGYNGVYTVLQSTPGRIIYTCAENDNVTKYGRIFTGDSLFVVRGDSRLIITPRYSITNPYYLRCDTVAGSPNIVIEDKDETVRVGDVVFIETQISVGGVILFGAYQVKTAEINNQYSIVSVSTLGAPYPATKTETNKGVTPVFNLTPDTAVVEVVLPDHKYVDGDTFTILVPQEIGGIVLQGNYIVTRIDSANNNSFTIVANNTYSAADNNSPTVTTNSPGLIARPFKASSDGFFAYLQFQSDFGVAIGDQVTITGTNPSRDGTYTVEGYDRYTLKIRSNQNWNNLTQFGSIWKSSGASAGKLALAYYGEYAVNVGDKVILSNFVDASYNGSWDVVSSIGSRLVITTNGTGNITAPGSFYVSSHKMNGGKPRFRYFKAPMQFTVPTGYGVGGYGEGGYGIGGQGIPDSKSVPVVADDWSLDNWGEILVACPVGGPIYEWSSISGAAQAALIDNCPIVNDGCFVAMPQRQIIAWGSTFNGIQDPLLIRWCDVANYNSWIATVVNQAGSYRISKGSRIVGGLQGPQQGLIWTDIGLWSMQYVGQPIVYQFTEVGTGCGLIARRACGSLGNVIYWMGQSQFFMMSGNGMTPIDCPVWDAIFQDIDENNVDKIRFAANSNFNEVQWFYPSKNGGTGEIDKYVKYNTLLNCWDIGDMARTAWINQSVLGPPIGAGVDRFIYQHETSLDADTSPIASSFQTGYAQIAEGEYKVFVDQVWPDFKWGYYDGKQDADLQMTFYVTDYPGDEPRVHGPYNINRSTEYITPRFRGRLVSIKFESKDVQSFWRIGAVRYRYTIDGKF